MLSLSRRGRKQKARDLTEDYPQDWHRRRAPNADYNLRYRAYRAYRSYDAIRRNR